MDGVGRRSFLRAAGAGVGVALCGTAAGRSTGATGERLLVGVSAAAEFESVEASLPPCARVLRRNETLGYLLVALDADSEYERLRVEASVAGIEGVRYTEHDGEVQAFVTPVPDAGREDGDGGDPDGAGDDPRGDDEYPGGWPPDGVGTTVTDPRFEEQYAPQAVNAPAAWERTHGEGATIAVVDGGVLYDHPDLRDRFGVQKGRDFVDGDDDPYPEDRQEEYHGTHVAGIAAATTDNAEGVAGISDARLLSCRALASDGTGNFSDIADAVQWATDQGADVINLSLGGGGRNRTMKAAVSYAVDNGALPVAAAGNSGIDQVSYPARFEECVAVGALEADGDRARFSQYGPNLELVAPGVDVLSTWTEPGRPYARLSGTSMACPVVSGVAALGTTAHPERGPADLRALLRGTAVDAGLPGEQQGYGRVDAAAVVERAPADFPPTAAFTVGDDHPDPGAPVAFDATDSADPEGGSLTYEWAFGDGTVGFGERTTHTYTDPGEYAVALTVTDDALNTDTRRRTLTVRGNETPTATLTPRAPSVVVDQEITFRGRFSEDPDGSIATYEWEFGDGTTAEGPFVDHSYDGPGEYTVTLTVTDDDGGTDRATTTVTVRENRPPSAAFTLSTTEPAVGESVEVDAGQTGDDTGEVTYYGWTFGDGTTERGQVEEHAYGTTGEYTLELTVEDEYGLRDTASTTVTVTEEGGDGGETTVGDPGDGGEGDDPGGGDPPGSPGAGDGDGGAGSGAGNCGGVRRTTLSGRIEDGGRWVGEYETTGLECAVDLSLDGPDGADTDLYVTVDGRTPTPADYDRRSWSFGPDESLTVEASETLGVLVDAYAGGGAFEVTVEEHGADGDGGGPPAPPGGAPPADPPDGGVPGDGDGCTLVTHTDAMRGSLDRIDEVARFEYAVHGDPCSVTVTLSGPADADFDLHVTTDGRPAGPLDADRASTTQDSSERVVLDGVGSGGELGIGVSTWAGTGPFEVTVEETGRR